MARHVHQYLRPLVNMPIYIGSKASTFDLEVTTVFFSSAHFFVQYDSKMLDVKWEVCDEICSAPYVKREVSGEMMRGDINKSSD